MIYAWTNASGVGVGVRCDDDEHLHPFLPSGRMRHGPNHDIVVQYEGLLTYHQYYMKVGKVQVPTSVKRRQLATN